MSIRSSPNRYVPGISACEITSGGEPLRGMGVYCMKATRYQSPDAPAAGFKTSRRAYGLAYLIANRYETQVAPLGRLGLCPVQRSPSHR